MRQVFPTAIQSGVSQSGSCVLVLSVEDGRIQVPIIIGSYEAQSILLAREGVRPRRPMTHELMASMMDAYGLTLRMVTIDRLVEGIFYSTLHVSDGFVERNIDSRTTDAVTLALLCGAPIMMDDKVLEEAGAQAEPSEPEETMEQLEAELHRCEAEEEYERAELIQKKIDKLKGQSS